MNKLVYFRQGKRINNEYKTIYAYKYKRITS